MQRSSEMVGSNLAYPQLPEYLVQEAEIHAKAGVGDVRFSPGQYLV